jgi:glycosyltransferase involved in cell wall biosynthesis
MGVDVQVFQPNPAARKHVRQRLGWRADGPPVIGYSGRFVEEKGIRFLIQLIDGLGDVDWRLLLIGGGPLRSALERWAAGYPDRVRVVTGVDHDEVPAFINAMDVLCAPSLTWPTWREQFGRMLVEAFGCGVPVLGSDSGEIPHVIRDAGVVAREGDVRDWTVKLTALLDSPSDRATIGARGLQRAHERYSWPVVAAQHLAFFDEVLLA